MHILSDSMRMNRLISFSPVQPQILRPEKEPIAQKKENKNYNILNWFMSSAQFDNDPFIPGWVKGAVHTAERIGTIAVIGLFLGWLSVTLLTRDDERNVKFLAMCQETNVRLQELTVAVHELRITVENKNH